MSDHLLFVVLLAACVCGACIAVGVLEYVVWLAKQEEGGEG